MSYLLAGDSINGKLGKAFLVKNGENIELFGLKKIEINAEVQTADFAVVGTLINQKKPKGISYTGSATIYYGTPAFLKILQEYKRTGKFPTVNMQVINEDKSSSVGRQVTAIYNVIFDKIPIAMLDDSADHLQEEISFSFTAFEVLEAFKDTPAQLG